MFEALSHDMMGGNCRRETVLNGPEIAPGGSGLAVSTLYGGVNGARHAVASTSCCPNRCCRRRRHPLDIRWSEVSRVSPSDALKVFRLPAESFSPRR